MNNRQEYIAEQLKKEQFVKVSDLASYFMVTTETIRRDFDELEEQGMLVRVYGGAVLPNYFKATEPLLESREKINTDIKCAIAHAVAETIIPGESIIIDNGTTCLELAKAIAGRNDITIITPSFKIADVLYGSGNRVCLLGGWLRKAEPAVSGSITMEQMRNFNVNRTFMSASGVDVITGINEFTEEDASIKRCAIECAERTVLLADSAKFKAKSLINVAPIESFSEIYTDEKLPPDFEKILVKKNIEVVKVKVH